jgi:hypothetical protein
MASFDRPFQAVRKRLETLEQHLGELPYGPNPSLAKDMEGLSTVLGNLYATIDDLHQRNEKLKNDYEGDNENLRRYKKFFECAPGGYLVTDCNGII